MSRFNNLRLAYRLGIAFGALILALVVIGGIAVSKINALDAETENLSAHDALTLEHALTIEQRIQRASYLTASHLYIHDGDLKSQDAVDKANERLSRPEQIKAFELLPVEWTAESEELTPTLKLKRRVVNTKYADVLDRLYS